MHIAVISDLHLGPGDASDAFGHQDTCFERFLDQLETDFERVVLLGDIWETLTSPRANDPEEGLRRAREAHPSMARRLAASKYVYVYGNHDLIAARVDGAASEWTLDVDGLRLLFTHGHHHDWLIRRCRWLSEWLVWLGAWTQRLGCEAIYHTGYCLDRWLTRPGNTPHLDSFQSWALKLARERSADVVITGHTHLACSASHRGRLFLNSGSCSQGHFSYLTLDTTRCEFGICQAM